MKTTLFAALATVAISASAQELSIGLSTPVTTMDPHFHNLTPNNSIAKHIFETLVHQDDQQALKPGLAESWRATDGTTWEIKLRKNVRWHDGTPFTAEDVLDGQANQSRSFRAHPPAAALLSPTVSWQRRVRG